ARLTETGHHLLIFTSDKDALQLLSPQVTIINPVNNEKKDLVWLQKQTGLSPRQVVDWLALAGDASDHVPGVRGIGEKTALRLLHEFQSLEQLYQQLDRLTSASLREKLRRDYQQALLSRQLVCLRTDLPLDLPLSELKVQPPRLGPLLQLCQRLEMKKLSEQVKEFFDPSDKLFFSRDSLLFSDGTVVAFEEIVKHPEQFSTRLSNPSEGKSGYHLKEKAVRLSALGISMAGLEFDFALAQHLTGQVLPEENLVRLKQQYQEIISELGLERLFYEVEMPLISVLVWMENSGIAVDGTYLHQLSSQMKDALADLERKIYQAADEVFNINSPQQLARILFEKIGLPPQKKTRSSYSTDTSVLQELARQHPLPALLIEYRELFKLKTTYVDGLLATIRPETGRIHPTFNQMATTTGRLSCSQPNLQNLPIRTSQGSLIRRAFCAAVPASFFSFDYNQIELRVLAHYSQDPVLVGSFLKNRDIHQETAERLFSSDSLFTGQAVVPSEGDRRRLAKTINFGVIYGMSPFGLSRQLNMSVQEAQLFITKYFETFRGVADYIQKTQQQVKEQGYVTSLLGRRRYLPEISHPDRSRQEFARRAAINMPIQGTAADLIKVAMNNIYSYFCRHGLKSRLVLQIHDELLFEIFPDEEKHVPAIQELMEKALPLSVPVRVDVQKGQNYLEMEKLSLAQ
ncbi:MAG TPA: DNA polymerase, partial [bacterium]|nr:DNA polymerase [bacterium]